MTIPEHTDVVGEQIDQLLRLSFPEGKIATPYIDTVIPEDLADQPG